MSRVVYKLTFGDGSFYIGSTKDPDKRLYAHVVELKRHTHKSSRVQDAFDRCGKPRLTIMANCEWPHSYEIERALIAYSGNNPLCCNHNGNIPDAPNEDLLMWREMYCQGDITKMVRMSGGVLSRRMFSAALKTGKCKDSIRAYMNNFYQDRKNFFARLKKEIA